MAGRAEAATPHFMMSLDTLVLLSYFFVLSILGIYGWHRYYLVFQYSSRKLAL